MPTKLKPRAESLRPNRRLGEALRMTVGCPLCRVLPAFIGNTLRVVAWRSHTVRLECPKCGLRFSIDTDEGEHAFSQAIRRTPDTFLEILADAEWNRGEV